MRRIIWLLAALSFVLRVALVAQAGRLEMPSRAWDRGYEVGAVAQALTEGRGFADPFGERTGATAAVGPAVAALWSLPMRAFGTSSPMAWMLIVLLDCLALALVVPALFALGRRAVGERFGLVCTVAWTVHPVALLLARKADVNAKDSEGQTPLAGLLATMSACGHHEGDSPASRAFQEMKDLLARSGGTV